MRERVNENERQRERIRGRKRQVYGLIQCLESVIKKNERKRERGKK